MVERAISKEIVKGQEVAATLGQGQDLIQVVDLFLGIERDTRKAAKKIGSEGTLGVEVEEEDIEA